MAAKLDILVEVGSKRAFAAALEWPGWCRPGRDEDAAIEALLAAGARYKRTIGSPARGLSVPREAGGFTIVERVKGDATTDFGAPSKEIRADRQPIDDVARWEKLLRACWRAFDASVGAAEGVELRKGPRGGGRELDGIVAHVLGADEGYLRSFGAHPPKDSPPEAAMEELRRKILATFRSRVRGEPPERVGRSGKVWSPRYFARRSAWHSIDHVWEIEDRSG